MATLEKTFYVHAFFTKEGKFSNFSVQGYKINEQDGKYGFLVFLYERTLSFDVPDNLDEVYQKGAEEVEAIRVRLGGKHQMEMMQLAAAKNAMLGLEHSEVLDVEREPTKRLYAED